MIVLSVIGSLWLGCLLTFVVMAIRAPTIENMPDHRVDLTAEMVVELRRMAARAHCLHETEQNSEEIGRRAAS